MVEATQAYHPQVMRYIRAIAMYEASARPRRRRPDRRASPGTANAWTGSHHNETRRSIVMATPSNKERMKAARAAARAQREAERAVWRRGAALMVEVGRLALDAVKASIRARGDNLQLYTPAQLQAQAGAMIGPWLVAQARAKIAERNLQDKSNAEVRS